MTITRSPSEIALQTIKEDMEHRNLGVLNGANMSSTSLPPSVMEAWESLPQSVRSLLIETESSRGKSSANSSASPDLQSTSGVSSSCLSSESSDRSSADNEVIIVEKCKFTGAKVTMKPLDRAPKNVFSFIKTNSTETVDVSDKAGSTVTTTTKVVTTNKGWRNVFHLPISYDVNMVKHGTILDPSNPQLLMATGNHPEDYNRRFAVVDAEVDKLFGVKIREYFAQRKIDLTISVLNGGEADKRPEAVDKLLDDLCAYKLRRREPFLAIGGGCLLDIAGMAACMYRRGVPFVRVPTTLLAIVDASVGVKNGVDYCCGITDETYKNRVGSFYAPSSCLLDASFISTQDARNISNGFGEIVKLALVRSSDLFELVETYGMTLIDSRFGAHPSVPSGVSNRIIELSIQIMLEELGPNLWETVLDRCVDYGHTFSKLLEMVPGADIMHGEAVNVDGFFCCILSYLRGYIDMETVERVFKCMKSLSLPTNSKDLTSSLAWQSCKDAIEHRHGEQRIPLITEIGASICVSDVTQEELDRGLEMMKEFPH